MACSSYCTNGAKQCKAVQGSKASFSLTTSAGSMMSLARPRLNRRLFRNKLKIASEATLHSSCRRPRAGGRRSGAARALCLPLLLFFLFFFFLLLLLRAAVQGSIALPGYAPSPWLEKQDQSTHTKGSHCCQVRSNLPRLPTSGSLLNLLPSPCFHANQK